MTEEIFNYDVLVVGSGNAGCSAALAALDGKARVGILEKGAQQDRGGNSALTGHMRFAYNGIDDLRPLVKYLSEPDLRKLVEWVPHHTEAEIWDDLMEVTNGQSDPEMLQVHVSESLRTVHWLAAKGHEWVPTGLTGNNYAENILLMNGGGYGLQQRHFSMLESAGATFHCGTAATELILDGGGRVAGVRALTLRGSAIFKAKSVVLACGGFEANPEMRARYLGPGWDMINVRGVPFNTGDGLRMALAIGAMPHGSWTTCHSSPQDVNLPPSKLPSAYALTGANWSRYMYPYSIMVNTNGERFVDEAADTLGKTYAKMGRAILAQPGGTAFQIMDARVRKMNLYSANYSQSHATTAQANTLEQLAQKLDINEANFVRTVRAFNAAIQPGEFNPDHMHLDGKHTAGITPPKSNYALSIEEPPFEAWPVRCGITFTFGGLKIDPTLGQVQHVAGRPMAGLYAAGEMVGGLFVGNYASGSGMMAGATFGRIAGTHAAIAALEL